MGKQTLLKNWIKPNLALLFNASSLVATTTVTSFLGFIYWWLAARWFPPEAVGLAAAAISAMLLLGTIGVMGFGTLLIGELPRQGGNEGELIITSLMVVLVIGVILGLLFAIITPLLSSDLLPLGENVWNIVLFTMGVSLTSVTLVLDQALIGLLHGELQLARNFLHAAGKLIAVIAIGVWLADKHGMMLFVTWVVGILASLLILVMILIYHNKRIIYLPKWNLIRNFGHSALIHHSLNMALQIPGYLLPIIVTVLLSARLNAYFYVAWMVASFVYVVPAALSTVLYAISAADPATLAKKLKFTLALSLAFGVMGNIALLVLGGHILGLFGSIYNEQALILRILGLGVFPLIVRVHYVAIYRVHKRIMQATKLIVITSLIALVLASIGARFEGLYGLSLGWVAGMFLEAIIMTPVLVSVAVFKEGPSVREEDYEDQHSPRIDSPSTDSSRVDI